MSFLIRRSLIAAGSSRPYAVGTFNPPAGEINVPYKYDTSQLFTGGVIYEFTASNTLPAGLSLDSGTGIISGTPTVSTTVNISITASNPSGSDTTNAADVVVNTETIETVTDTGGVVKDGEKFSISYTPGGLTGATSVQIGGVSCTNVVVINDTSLTATAPADDLLHGVSYNLVIS